MIKKKKTLYFWDRRMSFGWSILNFRKLINYFSLYLNVYFKDISKVQDDEVGDGTTSVTVLACELLRVKFIYIFIKLII